MQQAPKHVLLHLQLLPVTNRLLLLQFLYVLYLPNVYLSERCPGPPPPSPPLPCILPTLIFQANDC